MRGALSLLVVLVPMPALAEGDVRPFDCTVTRTCTDAGNCIVDGSALEFALAPVSIGPDGTGLFELQTSIATYSADLSADRRLSWASADWTQNDMIFTGPETIVWIKRNFEPPQSELHFLTCKEAA
ncbi:MAG: hypothetical protein GKR98_04895 [Boseongicola sp.]|nr:MAG: hypothetical protein GKR98_04895 [Boseongicola sp.]